MAIDISPEYGADPVGELHSLSGERLEQEMQSLSAAIARATCRFLLLLAEYDSRRLWQAWECRSAAHWLAWRCGLSLGTAHEHVRVAHALRALPQLRDRFSRGALSYSKVRAISRVATASDEDVWLGYADSMTAGQLERIAQSSRRPTVAEDRARHDARTVATWWDRDGMLVVQARLAPEEGEFLLAALESGVAAVDESSAEESSWLRQRADALIGLVRVGAGVTAGTGAVPSAATPATVTVHVDAAALAGSPGMAHLASGEAVSPGTARRLACDAVITPLLRGRGDELRAVGRRRRLVSAAQRLALQVRDDGRCQVPGCDARRFTDVHHVVHWADGGTSDLDNLITLCSLHHRRQHEGAFTIASHGPGRFRFRLADGRSLLPAPRPDAGVAAGSGCDDRLLEGAGWPVPERGRMDRASALLAVATAGYRSARLRRRG